MSHTKPEHAPLDDEDGFCSEAYEQNGSYKSIVTATKFKGGGATGGQCSHRQLQVI